MEAKLKDINEFVKMINGINGKLKEFNETLAGMKMPNVEEEFAVARGMLAKFTDSVDAVIKTARAIPDQIIAEFQSRMNLIIYSMLLV